MALGRTSAGLGGDRGQRNSGQTDRRTDIAPLDYRQAHWGRVAARVLGRSRLQSTELYGAFGPFILIQER